MLKIGELAREAGVTAKTVRYYELLGLVQPAARTESGYRLYDRRAAERLVFVRRAKELGLSLEEVRELLAAYDAEGPPCRHVLALLDRKVVELGDLIAELQAFRDELVRLREESARAGAGEGGGICGIVERGVHARGQQALLWLESRRATGKAAPGSRRR